MECDLYIQESPKEQQECMSEEQMLSKIFPLKYETMENLDAINLDKLYYLNAPSTNKSSTFIKSIENEESNNSILLMDDYENVFNKLQSNRNEQQTNNINCYDYNYCTNDNYEKEDYIIPSFIKDYDGKNNYFHAIKEEDEEVFVKVEEPLKKSKKNNIQDNKIPSQGKKDSENPLKKKNVTITRKKRGPYKKKNKMIVEAKTDDKFFPFTAGKGVIKYCNNLIQLNSNASFLEITSSLTEEIEEKEIEKNEDKKVGDMISINELYTMMNNDSANWKFTTKKYFIANNGKKRRVKKKRKFKPDDIRKKIKARFHKIIKNIINENLKKAGSKELFDFLPQAFIGNVSKKVNNKILDLTYKEILLNKFQDELKLNYLKVDNTKYLRNQKVLKYLEENPVVAKRAGFDIIQDMKYKDLLRIYFMSQQFENSIDQLKHENESSSYIQEYIHRAKTYITFYSIYDNNEEKKNKSLINE